jgi:hypothetical protein
MRAPALTPILIAGLLLAGCSLSERVGSHINPSSMSLAERCAAMMQAAMPYADIDIGKATSQNKGVSTILAHVEGTRTDHPDAEGISRNLIADCEFSDTVLASFHLTGFGPEH